MTKSMKFNAKTIINIRKGIDAKKKDYWNNIRTTNLLSTKEVKNGYRKYDLKALYNEIMQMSEKLVMIKGMLATLNTGCTTFDKDAFKKNANELAAAFIKNFANFSDTAEGKALIPFGPQI